MGFVFSLQTLLRVREIFEQAELQGLQTIAAQVDATRAEMETLDRLAEEDRREVWQDSLSGLSGAELRFHLQREAARREQYESLGQKLLQLETARQAQQARYLQARQQREILSTLRERQEAEYKIEQSRREQRAVDELFLMRRASRAADSEAAGRS